MGTSGENHSLSGRGAGGGGGGPEEVKRGCRRIKSPSRVLNTRPPLLSRALIRYLIRTRPALDEVHVILWLSWERASVMTAMPETRTAGKRISSRGGKEGKLK